jgi:hypothetical protein
MEDLKQINIKPSLRMCSFDIDSMYPNILKWQVLDIISSIYHNIGILKVTSCGINTLVKTIVKQNYFEYNSVIYQQMEGIAMGAPSSLILLEIFI